MGVFDLKMDPSGVPVFLELNPQGQFLFVEGLTGMDLIGAFSGFCGTRPWLPIAISPATRG